MIGSLFFTSQNSNRVVTPLISTVSFLIGNLLFSGSLYIMVLSGYKSLGMITPIGGVSYLIGWAA